MTQGNQNWHQETRLAFILINTPCCIIPKLQGAVCQKHRATRQVFNQKKLVYTFYTDYNIFNLFCSLPSSAECDPSNNLRLKKMRHCMGMSVSTASFTAFILHWAEVQKRMSWTLSFSTNNKCQGKWEYTGTTVVCLWFYVVHTAPIGSTNRKERFEGEGLLTPRRFSISLKWSLCPLAVGMNPCTVIVTLLSQQGCLRIREIY